MRPAAGADAVDLPTQWLRSMIWQPRSATTSFGRRRRDRTHACRLNDMNATSAMDDRTRCSCDQLFPFFVVRLRSPASAGANTPSSALAE